MGAVVVGTIDKTQLGIYTIVLNVNAFLFMVSKVCGGGGGDGVMVVVV